MERVGLDLRVQGRAAAVQEIKRTGQAVDDLGRDMRDTGQDAERTARQFDEAMSRVERVSQTAQRGVGADLDRIGRDLRELPQDADRAARGFRGAFDNLQAGGAGGGGLLDGIFGGGGRAALAGAAAAAGTAAAGALAAAFRSGLQQEQAVDVAAAAAGMFNPTAQGNLSDVIDSLYRGAYGSDYGEVAGAVSAASRLTGTRSPAELEALTAAAFTLADTFGASIDEVLLGVGNLATTTGTDVMTVFDQVAASVDGVNGVFRSDLFDVLGEYAAQIDDLGLTSEQFLSVLAASSTRGVTNLDVVADSLKEFLVVMRGGGAPVEEALASLGFSDGRIRDTIRALNDGGPGAAQTLNDVLDALRGADAIVRGEAMATLGAGPLENLGLGVEGIEILQSFDDGLDGVNGSLADLNQLVYDNRTTDLTAQWREFTDYVTDFTNPAFTFLLEGVNAIFDTMRNGIDPTSRLGRHFSFIGEQVAILTGSLDDLHARLFGGASPLILNPVAPKPPTVADTGAGKDFGTGGGGAATFLPSGAPVTVQLSAFDGDSMERWLATGGARRLGLAVAREVDRAGRYGG